jgi:hypothetical protein
MKRVIQYDGKPYESESTTYISNDEDWQRFKKLTKEVSLKPMG